MMDAVQYLPSSLLLATGAVACVFPSAFSVAALGFSSALWGFHYFTSRPVPPPPKPDDARFAALEHKLEDMTRQIDSVKTAVNMRQLR